MSRREQQPNQEDLLGRLAAFSFIPDVDKALAPPAPTPAQSDKVVTFNAAALSVPAGQASGDGEQEASKDDDSKEPCAVNTNSTAAVSATASVVASLFYVYHKCEGDDAVLLVDNKLLLSEKERTLIASRVKAETNGTGTSGRDGSFPIAMLNPFAIMSKENEQTTLADAAAVLKSCAVDATVDGLSNPKTSSRVKIVDALREAAARLEKAEESLALPEKRQPGASIGGAAVVTRHTVEEVGIPALCNIFDIVWVVDASDADQDNTIRVGVLYNGSVFVAPSVANWADMLGVVAGKSNAATNKSNAAAEAPTEVSAASPDTTINVMASLVFGPNALDLMTASMKKRLLHDWQAAALAPEEYERTLPDIFYETMMTKVEDPETTPAILEPSTGRQLSYAETWRRANRLARYLHTILPEVAAATVPSDSDTDGTTIDACAGIAGSENDNGGAALGLDVYKDRKPIGRWGIDATVGIHVPRCADWYVMMIGVHLAGGAYLSLDPDFPADRLLYALEDSSAVCLLTTTELAGTLGFTGPTVAIDQVWGDIDSISDEEVVGGPRPAGGALLSPRDDDDDDDVDASAAERALVAGGDFARFPTPSIATSPAYLIYTSGSTGKPKGVLIEHRNACNFVMSEVALFKLDNTHRVLQGFSTSFDASVEEIWLAFASGSALVVVDKAVMQDVEALAQLVKATQATVLSTVPTLLATMDAHELQSLRIVIAGAEACGRDVVEAYATGGDRKFINSYGPTEATVACMADFSQPTRPVTIGRPQPGYFACILNEKKELCPPGVPGELCMAGPSVARGYVGRPELNAEKFVKNPFWGGDAKFARMYHTGDLTRWNSEGRVEFLGRIDSQVKLRGFRIEVGEIEAHLSHFDGVKAAIVHLVKDAASGQPFLCGYLLCDDALKAAFDEQAFKQFLEDKVPHYMVPARFCTIDAVPRSPAGKLDRKQLAPPPAPKRTKKEGADDGPVPPKGPIEEEIFEIWAQMFPGQTFGVTDTFFDLGGHSLLAGKAASKIRQAGYGDFSIRLMYSHPTIRQVSVVLAEMKEHAPEPPCPTLPPRFEPSMLRKALFLVWQFIVSTYCMAWQWAYLLIFFAVVYGRYDATIEDWCGGRDVRFYLLNGTFLQATFAVCLLVNIFFIVPATKWLIFLGRAQEGNYSIWSLYYLRWWTARAIAQPAGLMLFHGTYLWPLQLRMMGMSCGGGVVLSSHVVDPDLLEIGDDAFIGDNCVLATSEVIDGVLHLRRVKIGAAASINARACLRGGSVIGDGAVIQALTLIPEDTTVPAGELWAGSPGKKVGVAPTLPQLLEKLRQEDAKKAANVAEEAEAKKKLATKNKNGGVERYAAVNGDDLEESLILADGDERDDAPRLLYRRQESRTDERSVMTDLTTTYAAIRAEDEAAPSDAIRPNLFVRFLIGLLQLIYFLIPAVVSSNPVGIMTFAAWILCDFSTTTNHLWYVPVYFVAAPAFTAVVLLYQHALLILMRWVVFPWSPQPGLYKSTSLFFQRKLFFDTLSRFSLIYAHPMYGTIFTQYYLKAMGCKVGRQVECSNLFGFTPGVTTFADNSFVADFCGVNPPSIHRGVMLVDTVRVGERAFVGNGSVLPGGSEVGDRSLLGLTSLCPEKVPEGSTMIGSPAFDLPRQVSADDVEQEKTFNPSCILVVRRVLWEFFRCVMPGCFISYSAVFAYVAAALLFYEEHNLTPMAHEGEDIEVTVYVALALLFVWFLMIGNVFFALLVKWVIVGKHVPEENPLWSPGVWRAEFVVDTTTVIGLTGILNLARGTSFLPWFFRRMGATIGKEVFLDTLFMTEPDMVTLGDGVSVNFNATLQTHLFEDRVMKVDKQRIDARCSVGAYSVVLYNTHVGEGSTISPISLVMKGEAYPARTHWHGIPGARRSPPALMRPGGVTPNCDLLRPACPFFTPSGSGNGGDGGRGTSNSPSRVQGQRHGDDRHPREVSEEEESLASGAEVVRAARTAADTAAAATPSAPAPRERPSDNASVGVKKLVSWVAV